MVSLLARFHSEYLVVKTLSMSVELYRVVTNPNPGLKYALLSESDTEQRLCGITLERTF